MPAAGTTDRVASPDLAAEQDAAPTPRPPGRPVLLIVDDEVDVLDSLRYLFHRKYRVLTAEGGERALEVLRDEEVHVILSDQRMPGMSGDVLLGHARKLFPDAIRMLFTGYADLDAVIRAVNEGHIYRYIVKPWDPSELESIVGQAVEQYELLAERKRLIAELRGANARLTQLNASLAEASQLKTAFIEVASHEFNTPITLVLGLSELLLLKDPGRNAEDRRVIEQIARSAKQLAKLVADTLTLMRSNAFGTTVHRSPVDLGLLLHEAADRLMPFVELRRIRFDVDVTADLGTFELDAPKVRDAVLNLLTNALKFTPDGGEIALGARLTGPDQAEIVVEDKGIGMEDRAVKRLFEPFFTEFDPSRHSTGDFGFEKRGLGLGLCIVRQFVELHGGRIGATSERGRGTRVTIHLPRRPFPGPQRGVE
ncbi:MAG TPA: hybrid sensor histidine kinase/response regulator [Isosphaeraceae bacterium]